MTVAELKRNAKAGSITLELLQDGMWAKGIPARLMGIRKCIGCQTNAILMENAADPTKPSYLYLPPASLVEYANDTLKIYKAGFRRPNAAEQKVLDEWKSITDTPDFKKRVEIDCRSDGSSTHFQHLRFLKDKGFDYLDGTTEKKGLSLRLDKYYRGEAECIRDNSIKGELLLSYKVYHN